MDIKPVTIGTFIMGEISIAYQVRKHETFMNMHIYTRISYASRKRSHKKKYLLIATLIVYIRKKTFWKRNIYIFFSRCRRSNRHWSFSRLLSCLFYRSAIYIGKSVSTNRERLYFSSERSHRRKENNKNK